MKKIQAFQNKCIRMALKPPIDVQIYRTTCSTASLNDYRYDLSYSILPTHVTTVDTIVESDIILSICYILVFSTFMNVFWFKIINLMNNQYFLSFWKLKIYNLKNKYWSVKKIVWKIVWLDGSFHTAIKSLFVDTTVVRKPHTRYDNRSNRRSNKFDKQIVR